MHNHRDPVGREGNSFAHRPTENDPFILLSACVSLRNWDVIQDFTAQAGETDDKTQQNVKWPDYNDRFLYKEKKKGHMSSLMKSDLEINSCSLEQWKKWVSAPHMLYSTTAKSPPVSFYTQWEDLISFYLTAVSRRITLTMLCLFIALNAEQWYYMINSLTKYCS